MHKLTFILLILLLLGCSTKKNTFVNRSYHNLVSHYNILYNARNSFEEGMLEFHDKISEDFTHILPVYRDKYFREADVAKEKFERTIQKSLKLITKHSITSKPRPRRRSSPSYEEFAAQKEFNRFVDEAYLLIAESEYYMRYYFEAIAQYSYIMRRFEGDEAYFKGGIGLIRVHNQNSSFKESLKYIKILNAKVGFPEHLLSDFYAVQADYYLSQDIMNEGYTYLQKAYETATDKTKKARYAYILGQLSLEDNNTKMADFYFAEVLSNRPREDMKFAVKINSSKTATGENKEALERKLRFMLRNAKYRDYQDQIYFALGNLYMTEGDEKRAIKNYKTSLAVNSKNIYQRVLSALTLAELFFEKKDYLLAATYYQDVLSQLPENYQDYDKIKQQGESLVALSTELNTILITDSLVKVSAMSPEEYDTYIEKLIQIEEQQRKVALAEELERQKQLSDPKAWYFYNANQLEQGRKDFKQKYGVVEFTDFWLYPQMKNFATLTTTVESERQDTLTNELKLSEATQAFLARVPKKPEDFKRLDSTRKRAYYNGAQIYWRELNEREKAIELLESYLATDEPTQFFVQVYFDLYKLYGETQNSGMQNTYREKIIQEFPTSKFAQYIQDPSFIENYFAKEVANKALYDSAYILLQRNEHNTAYRLLQEIQPVPDTAFMDKAEILTILAKHGSPPSIAMSRDIEAFLLRARTPRIEFFAKDILKKIQNNWARSVAQMKPQDYLPSSQEDSYYDKSSEENGFSLNVNFAHYFVVLLLDKRSVDISQLQYDIASYNIDNYSFLNFDISRQDLNSNEAMIVVRSMRNKEEALVYYNSIIQNREVFSSLGDKDYLTFTISSVNYTKVLGDGVANNYVPVFKKYYSQYISARFVDNNNISPEELMEKIRIERQLALEEEERKNKGKAVKIPGSKREKIIADYMYEPNTPHYYAVYFNTSVNLGRFLTSLRSIEFQGGEIEVEQEVSAINTPIATAGIFSSKDEAMSFFRTLILRQDIFQPLGDIRYRNIVISNRNLQELKASGDIGGYMKFYQENYLR